MTSGPLDPKVGEALVNDTSVVEIMQHPKMAEALQALKADPSAYQRLVSGDAELATLFDKLRGMMEEKEAESEAGAEAAEKYARPHLSDSGVPALAGMTPEAEADAAKSEGTAAFESGDFTQAASRYERAAALEPAEPTHWSNLAVARLRAGQPDGAVEAAREATRLNPRFAKGWLRLGEAQLALGESASAVQAFEAGLQRAEGAIRLALTKALQKAKGTPATHSTIKAKPKGTQQAAAEATPAFATAAPAPKPAPKPLPTLEEERRVAAETAELRRRTDEQMRKYADLAKQQTRAAAVAAPGAATRAPPAAPAGARKVVAIEAMSSDEEEEAEAVKAKAAGGSQMRKLAVEDDDDDDDEEEEARIVEIEAEAPKAAAAPPAGMRKLAIADDDSEDEEEAGGNASPGGADNLFAAALEQWSEGRHATEGGNATGAPPAAPAPRPAAPAPKPGSAAGGVKKGAPVMPLSNSLIFDLA